MIIGITGKKRSGKDTIANMLCWERGYSQFSLADPMRRFAREVFGWGANWIEEEKETVDPRYGISYRQFMQWLGTEAMQYGLMEAFPEFKKVTGRSVWIKRLERAAGKKMVISDVRFQHEADEIKHLGGIIIKVTRPGTCTTDNHPSEMELDSIIPDYTVANDGMIEKLSLDVKKIVDNL